MSQQVTHTHLGEIPIGSAVFRHAKVLLDSHLTGCELSFGCGNPQQSVAERMTSHPLMGPQFLKTCQGLFLYIKHSQL